jgi:hypothetical protein
MYCTKCGSKLEIGVKYCAECGFKVQESQSFVPLPKLEGNESDQSDYVKPNLVERSMLEVTNTGLALRPTLIKTIIVSNDSRKSASSSILRGAVGGALLGPIGIIGGAISGKNKRETTFLLIYNNGMKKTVTVKTNGLMFKQYVKYLEG